MANKRLAVALIILCLLWVPALFCLAAFDNNSEEGSLSYFDGQFTITRDGTEVYIDPGFTSSMWIFFYDEDNNLIYSGQISLDRDTILVLELNECPIRMSLTFSRDDEQYNIKTFPN